MYQPASLTTAAAVAFHLLPAVNALWPPNGVGMYPAMGWNTWNAFACDVDADLLLGMADKIAAYGLRDAGYEYVVLDDCWSAGRSENGTLQWNTTKFPQGIPGVADSLHANGFKMGIYSDAGTYTCGRYAGSLGYEKQDAATWASWGIDYLKYDNCYNEGQSGTPQITYNRYKTMYDALNSTDRQILYSLCNWGEDYPWKWAQTMSNSWRISGDIMDSFDRPDSRCPCTGDEGYNCALPGFHCSAMNILNKAANFADKGILFAHNDLDMLEVGNGGMSDDEYITHFTMWAALKSPLLMGNDIRTISARDLSILNNPAIIAVSQDPAASPVFRIWRYQVPEVDQYGQGEISMWSGSLEGGDQLVILLNAGNTTRAMNATAADIFVDSGGVNSDQYASSWTVHDLWANRMPVNVAQALIDGNSSSVTASNVTAYYYNATQTSYQDGLAKNDTLLLGKPVGTLSAGGTLQTQVPRHGVAAMRLRMNAAGKRKRDEL